MALSLSCPCGTRFEVEDTFAGQAVNCPECQNPVKAPAPGRGAARTSGLALASVVLALVGAFTVLGTLAAVALGLLALVTIARRRGELAGAGFAAFGIVAGLVFTGLTLFAYSKGELFGIDRLVRDREFSGKLDFPEEREVVRREDGFAITRPTERWGVGRPALVRELDLDSKVLLVNTARNAYLDVSVVDLAGRDLDQVEEDLLDVYRGNPARGRDAGRLQRMSHFRLRDKHALPAGEAGEEARELAFEVHVNGQPMAFLARLVKPPRGQRAYILQGWASRRRFQLVLPEVRRGMDSFRLLAGAGR
ncbi:MAG TPA: hypothetical protein VFA26_22175 [Gemmataceae bacterium]|nr:hypothetical protein [Gemmataceae bacterium]